MDLFEQYMKAKNNWRVVSRGEWGALPPRSVEPLNPPLSYVRITYTMTEPCRKKVTCSNILQELQVHHMSDLKLPDIECNFMVGLDGSVYVGRGWDVDSYVPGVHDPRLKGNCLHIGYIGHFEARRPPKLAELATVYLLEFARDLKLTTWYPTLLYFKTMNKKDVKKLKREKKRKKIIENKVNTRDERILEK